MLLANKKFRKWLILGLIVAIALGCFIYRYTREEAPSYMTIMPSYQDIAKKVYATGTLEGETQVEVGAQVSGQIEKLYVKRGDEVKKGDLLCEIDPKTAENKLKTAQAEMAIIQGRIDAKEAELKKLLYEHNRQQNLVKINASSKQDAESAEAAYVMAKAELAQLKAEYEQDEISVRDAETNLGYTKITAPIDGTVYAMLVDEGQTVNANQTTPTILKIATMDRMTVQTEISEADVVYVTPGMDCTFTILGLPHRTFQAKLGSIAYAPSTAEDSSSSSSSSSGSTSSQAIYYNAELNVDNQDRVLRIDMTADVTINIDSREHVLSVPITALRSENGTEGSVYVLENGQVNNRKIELGLRSDQYIEVVSGLKDSDEIVIGDDVKTAEQQANQNNRMRGPRI